MSETEKTDIPATAKKPADRKKKAPKPRELDGGRLAVDYEGHEIVINANLIRDDFDLVVSVREGDPDAIMEFYASFIDRDSRKFARNELGIKSLDQCSHFLLSLMGNTSPNS